MYKISPPRQNYDFLKEMFFYQILTVKLTMKPLKAEKEREKCVLHNTAKKENDEC